MLEGAEGWRISSFHKKEIQHIQKGKPVRYYYSMDKRIKLSL